MNFQHLDDAVAECQRLLQCGYVANGNWTLGQICRHMRVSIEANMGGYPTWMTVLGYPLRPILRTFILPRLLAGNSPKGVKTAGMFVPPSDLDDSAEVDAFAQCVAQFLDSDGKLHAHPGFGKMDREGFNHFHAAHAGHHLGFLDNTSTE